MLCPFKTDLFITDHVHNRPEMITEQKFRSLHFTREQERSRSQSFKFYPEKPDPESTLRFVQEPIKMIQATVKISAVMLVVVKQNGID